MILVDELINELQKYPGYCVIAIEVPGCSFNTGTIQLERYNDVVVLTIIDDVVVVGIVDD